jgi:phosphatidylserine decarboxylase
VRVSVFLGIHNVHAPYAPTDAEVVSVRRKAGKFHPAHVGTKSDFNELVETVRRCTGGGGATLVVVQIAGLVARRIVSFVEERQGEGEEVRQGSRWA